MTAAELIGDLPALHIVSCVCSVRSRDTVLIMSSNNRKVQVVESEKSATVISANWMLDVILARKQQELSRCERVVVNRITVDQKLAYKKFQTKINRTQLSYARATGNRALANDIMERTTFVLNTNVGNDDEEVLKKVWRAGSGRFNQKRQLAKTSTERNSAETTATEAKPANPVMMSRVLTAHRNPNVPMRPYTSIPSSTQPLVEKQAVNGRRRRPKTAAASLGRQQVQHAQDTDDARDIRTGFSPQLWSMHGRSWAGPTSDMESSHNVTPPADSRGPFQPRRASSGSGIGEDRTLTELHKLWVQAKNYEGRVKRFAESIRPLKTDKENSTDYYTYRAVKTATTAGRKLAAVQLSITPPAEYKDSGSLTFKAVDWNFDKRPSQVTDIKAF